MFLHGYFHYQKFGPFSSTDREAFGIPYSDAVTFGQMFIGHADLSFYHKQISSVTFLMHTIFDGSFRIEVSHREPGILFDGGRCLAVR